jgi:hemoglobin
MKKQHAKQKQFLAHVLGGPEPYTGRDMREAHAQLDLKEEDFNAIAGHLQATLQELKVDEALIGEVLTLVASTKDEVLNR